MAGYYSRVTERRSSGGAPRNIASFVLVAMRRWYNLWERPIGGYVPTAYRYFTCPSLPRFKITDRVASPQQTSLTADDDPSTVITYLGKVAGTSFERFKIEHQALKKVNAIVRRERVSQIIEISTLEAFYNRSEGYFLATGRGRVSADAFAELRRSVTPIRAEPAKLDLVKLLALGAATGGHFRNLQIAKVDSSALFGGTDVIESEEWQHYVDAGVLSAVNLSLALASTEEHVYQLTADRMVIIFKDLGEVATLEALAMLQREIDEALEAA